MEAYGIDPLKDNIALNATIQPYVANTVDSNLSDIIWRKIRPYKK